MPELIDRESFLELLRDCEAVTHSVGYSDMIAIIEDAPKIEAEPVRHGRWAKAADKQYCTECRAVTKVRNAPFCWNCGAKIDLRTPTEVQLDMADSVMMGG